MGYLGLLLCNGYKPPPPKPTEALEPSGHELPSSGQRRKVCWLTRGTTLMHLGVWKVFVFWLGRCLWVGILEVALVCICWKEKQVLLQGIRGCRKITNHILDTIDIYTLISLQTPAVYFLLPSLQLLEPGFFGLCLHVLGKFLFTCFAGSLQHIGREGHTMTGLWNSCATLHPTLRT